MVKSKRHLTRCLFISYINYYEKLPNNWILTTLSAAGSWKSGSTPDRHNTKFYNGKIPWIKTGELNDNLNLIKAEEYVTDNADAGINALQHYRREHGMEIQDDEINRQYSNYIQNLLLQIQESNSNN